MKVSLKNFNLNNKVVGVAVSGGADSMALLYYMHSNANYYGFKVIAVNVEHGIRGEESKSDTDFVKKYCEGLSIPIVCYAVDSVNRAKAYKLSLEEAARALRYECFFKCLDSGVCDFIATAHHTNDNFESVLLNLFRGSSLKGIKGINEVFKGKIIRPFLGVTQSEILEYVSENDIPYVVDQTNFDDDYTRNFLRLNVIPKIKEVFPEAEKSVYRLSQLAKDEDEFLDDLAKKSIAIYPDKVEIPTDVHDVIFRRATIIAMKNLGIKKDWESCHVESVLGLKGLENGSKVNLPKGILAIREYDKVVLYIERDKSEENVPFRLGEIEFLGNKISLERVSSPIDLKDGFYFDLDKIPKSAIIRTRRNGDEFTKFGGGTKALNDFMTDKKIPLRVRDFIPLIACGSTVLAVIGVAISDKIKVDETTKNIIKITKE
ncbi:MAG: tRNA lysidine(34) synthetase TilS [Clostridiales bacterium]|nr:tRNA lysidine(34) synthetase TilS [Clostridiales bacterium]